MKRISSALIPWWYKGIGLWLLGAIALFAMAYTAYYSLRGPLSPAWFIASLLLTAVGVVYIRTFVLPLADEVVDHGDALLVRRGRHSIRVPLGDIERVEYALVFDPPRIVLHAGSAGTVAFMPYLNAGMCVFREHPLVAELRERSQGARI